jgi:hypothetical protein
MPMRYTAEMVAKIWGKTKAAREKWWKDKQPSMEEYVVRAEVTAEELSRRTRERARRVGYEGELGEGNV